MYGEIKINIVTIKIEPICSIERKYRKHIIEHNEWDGIEQLKQTKRN